MAALPHGALIVIFVVAIAAPGADAATATTTAPAVCAVFMIFNCLLALFWQVFSRDELSVSSEFVDNYIKKIADREMLIMAALRHDVYVPDLTSVIISTIEAAAELQLSSKASSSEGAGGSGCEGAEASKKSSSAHGTMMAAVGGGGASVGPGGSGGVTGSSSGHKRPRDSSNPTGDSGTSKEAKTAARERREKEKEREREQRRAEKKIAYLAKRAAGAGTAPTTSTTSTSSSAATVSNSVDGKSQGIEKSGTEKLSGAASVAALVALVESRVHSVQRTTTAASSSSSAVSTDMPGAQSHATDEAPVAVPVPVAASELEGYLQNSAESLLWLACVHPGLYLALPPELTSTCVIVWSRVSEFVLSCKHSHDVTFNNENIYTFLSR